MFQASPLYLETMNATEDIIVHQGGTYSGKTYSLMQCLFSHGIGNLNETITIVGESVPNLKKGAMRDTDTIIRSSEQLQALIAGQNLTDRIITMRSGSKLEYTSYVTAQDAHSGKRDRLFINEAPGVEWAIAEQLINRTNKQVYIDYNPSIPFWAHEKLLQTMRFGAKSVKLIISDHRHNPFLTPAQHDHIEMRAAQDPEWGRVYGRGLTGKVEGLVFRNWTFCEDLPRDKATGLITAKLIGNGLDFGFTNDPTAGLAVYMQDGELWLDELIYQTELTNDRIFTALKDVPGWFVCDSAEPKSIAELRNFGLKVEPAAKGPDSILSSIDLLKRYKMNVTRRSVNLVSELNSYKWKIDKLTDKPMNEPVDYKNHLIDALRYLALNKLKPVPNGKYTII